MGLWVEMYLSPLKSDKPGTGYCLYSYVISPKANEENMSDRSLKKFYALLKSVFTDDEIYRAGGDEFMVLCLNDPKEEFEAKIDRIREIIKEEKDVNFAIGSCYNDGDLDVRKALRTADERMYKDKNLFYEKHPELKYR